MCTGIKIRTGGVGKRISNGETDGPRSWALYYKKSIAMKEWKIELLLLCGRNPGRVDGEAAEKQIEADRVGFLWEIKSRWPRSQTEGVSFLADEIKKSVIQ